MSPTGPICAALCAAALLLPAAAGAQTANGSPTDPAPRGLVGTPRPISRTAPSAGAPRRGAPPQGGPALSVAKTPAPKLTAAQLAEQRKLEHDMRICIGC